MMLCGGGRREYAFFFSTGGGSAGGRAGRSEQRTIYFFIFLGQGILGASGVEVGKPLPPRVRRERARQVPCAIALLPSNVLITIRPCSETRTIACRFNVPPLRRVIPTFRPFPIHQPIIIPTFASFRCIVRMVMLIATSSAYYRPFRFLRPSIPYGPFLT